MKGKIIIKEVGHDRYLGSNDLHTLCGVLHRKSVQYIMSEQTRFDHTVDIIGDDRVLTIVFHISDDIFDWRYYLQTIIEDTIHAYLYKYQSCVYRKHEQNTPFQTEVTVEYNPIHLQYTIEKGVIFYG